MAKENKVKSKTIFGKSTEEFDERLNNFLETDVVIISTHYSIAPRIVGTNITSSGTQGVYHSCLIFYQER
jgi:hypothetical protein